MPLEAAEKNYKRMKIEFLDLEENNQKWFFDADSFIDDYFVDNDFRKDFVDDCELPDKIKKDCNSIKSKFGY